AFAVEDHERGLGRVEWWAFGRDRVDASGRFDFSITDEDKEFGRQGLAKALELVQSDRFDLLVLDEVNSSTALGFLDEQAVLDLLEKKSEKLELILTGRNAPESFKQKAHLVSEVILRKHYFYSGVGAREGLDF
ncbi:MAG: cob(I)yrinic acid a,c-diamide adenosyltransferase, partial [Patescibacteria group bacterium]